MNWCAYNPKSIADEKKSCCDDSGGCGWIPTGDEEGYFDPSKVYGFNSGEDYWEETAGITEPCPYKWQDVDESKLYQGSCLNFVFMRRIDLLRWAITGGKPASCTTGYDYDYCDPDL